MGLLALVPMCVDCGLLLQEDRVAREADALNRWRWGSGPSCDGRERPRVALDDVPDRDAALILGRKWGGYLGRGDGDGGVV